MPPPRRIHAREEVDEPWPAHAPVAWPHGGGALLLLEHMAQHPALHGLRHHHIVGVAVLPCHAVAARGEPRGGRRQRQRLALVDGIGVGSAAVGLRVCMVEPGLAESHGAFGPRPGI